VVREIGLRDAMDSDLWDYAIQQEAVIVTLSLLQPPPSSFGLQRFSPTHF